ncbi:ATP-binding protein [Lactococcus protaetiae]|uniref:ATP-binding protein n=1 Tax=Lactococcus protaetiae TaxID=2592653 RepID=A0A514Z8R3_9LACT|nr:ATP-binding protein [Lactococcus protaetiae]QDK70984.1 ATP-binding protein [Lactococcus protaetiae]
MEVPSKKLGVIVGVDGTVAQVGMYDMSNDTNYIWFGNILSGPKVGAFLTINQNYSKIIAKVISEKVVDQQNTIKSTEFDNRYSKNSINRVIYLKTQGIIEDGIFQVTSSVVPMVGNEVTLTTQEEIKIIYNLHQNDATICVGKSILENQPILLSINQLFASHIGIFGNTGSGKSNTLHKVFLELFRSKYLPQIIKHSQFFVIDFNGEYTGKDLFGIDENHKRIFGINTRKPQNGQKLPVKKSYLFDADILSILFDARPATQVPFLRNALRTYREKISDGMSFANLEIGLLKSLIISTDKVESNSIDAWVEAASSLQINKSLFDGILNNHFKKSYGNMNIYNESNEVIVENNNISIRGEQFFKLEELASALGDAFNSASEIQKLACFLQFQKVYVSAWKSTNIEFINPLFHRIKTAFDSLEKVVEIKNSIENEFSTLNIISLLHANQEITRLLPMLLSKMIYDEQKIGVSENQAKQTKHLIIDEAHNILNDQFRNNNDDWQDYRLTVFEEIIKEGRKFGFYLTLSSQRPADISPTILSQVHNYFIHRLVNEKDLRMLENTMPTLDASSFQMIPSLGKGEVIITGNSMQVPVFAKISKEEKLRPSSDDINLTEMWSEENE